MPFTLCLPMSTAPPRHGPPAPMCPHGWLPSPHLLSPPALSGYLAQANTCRAYPWLPTYATTRPGLDPTPNRACAHHGPTRAADHLPQRTLLCSDKPSQDGSGCPKGMSTTRQHGMAGHHSSISPLFAPIVQCTPWYPQVYSRPYHRGAISTVRPGQGGTTRGRGHTATLGPSTSPSTIRCLNKPLEAAPRRIEHDAGGAGPPQPPCCSPSGDANGVRTPWAAAILNHKPTKWERTQVRLAAPAAGRGGFGTCGP